MATTLPRPPRSSFGGPGPSSAPPTSSLPALPRSVVAKSSTSSLRKPASSQPSSPRTPSKIQRPPSLTVQQPSPAMPGSPRSSPKRTVSIPAFPQPPRGGRLSLPQSPLIEQQEYSSGQDSPTLRTPTRMMKPKTSSGSNLAARFSADSGIGLMPGNRNSSCAGLSPPQSRSSSAQGSYSTQATTIDVGPSGEEDRGRSNDQGGEKEMKGNVIVSVRVRPDAPDSEEGGGIPPDWLLDGRNARLAYRGKDGGSYDYDNVFTPGDDNTRVYESCAKRLVRRVMEGYHGTVFAYGMTGTGKTFSMQGTTSSPGVIPLAITDIFSYIRETPHREFLLRVSYLEIYNERIHDLLASQPGGTGFVPLDQQTKGEEIKLREDPKRGVYATPLKEEIVQSPTQLLRVIARGDLARRVGSTQYNSRSSRSHAIVQIVVESRDRATNNGGSMADNRRTGMAGGVRVSTLSLIDLAGSERAAESKERRTEGSHINRSLLTLGNVIARLSKDGKGKDKDGNHLPYRDSKLTRLLQPALSGDSLISILCTIAIPAGVMIGANATPLLETMNTLKFAARAKNNLISHAKKSEESFGAGVDAGSRALLERYRSEISELKRELDLQKKREVEEMLERDRDREREREERMSQREAERHSEQMLEMQLARTALKERIEHLNRLILCSKSSGVNFSPRASTLLARAGSQMSLRSSLPTASNPARLSTTSSTHNLSDSSAANSDVGGDADAEEAGEFGDGSATLSAQVRALQSDLADRNRYISTLEKRLLHQSRNSSLSVDGSPVRGEGSSVDEEKYEMRLEEKDREIADLRARLDDKDRMLNALKSAARKRDVAESHSGISSTRSSRKGSLDTGGGGGTVKKTHTRSTSSTTGLRPLHLVDAIGATVAGARE